MMKTNLQYAELLENLSPKLSPATLGKPAYLLCAPFSLTSNVVNNIWMEEYSDKDRIVDQQKALTQFLQLYHFITSEALVYVLPAPADCGLQDIVYTANLAFIPEHLPEKDLVLISNFTSDPRKGESELGLPFFEALGYRTQIVPFRFEGEAEIKHLYDNVYIGGYGSRSERQAYEWMEETLDMTIIKVEEVDPYLYHLDCSVFPVTREDTLVCTELFTKEEIALIEKRTNVINVSADACYNGICNSCRLNNVILNASNIHELRANTEEYVAEIEKNRKLEDIAAQLGFEVAFFNLSEFFKSGALLSCMVMHLNRYSYNFRLL